MLGSEYSRKSAVEWYEKYKDEFCPLKARNQIGKETETERPAVFVEKNQFLPPTQKWGGTVGGLKKWAEFAEGG